ncbi:MAG: ZIP family metal transporter [Oscillospiraceae bacterium]|nr:ZIP family metal transporter [Oscillospiraceae bacterium]
MQLILFSAVAGIMGMGLGGLASVLLLRRPSENVTCWMLCFAAGIMTSIVCFGLIPEAAELGGVAAAIIGLVFGVIAVMLLNLLYDRITQANAMPGIHSTHEELYHGSHLINNPAQMIRSGMIMLIAIALHNIPEGIAIGAGGSHDLALGALLALMIALHNIPEGMAIAAPLLSGGINKWRVVLWTAASGATTLIGGIIGMLIGGLSDLAVGLSLSGAGGAMLYVVFGEIIPQSVIMTKNRAAPLVTLLGIIVGLVITQI